MARTTFDDTDREILNTKSFATLSTLRPDGTIWATPVWFDVEDNNILINGAEGRSWPTYLRDNGVVSLTVANAENPYQYVSITGRVAGETHDGADDVINRLAKKYIDQDVYPWKTPDEVRVTFTIAPTKIYRNR